MVKLDETLDQATIVITNNVHLLCLKKGVIHSSSLSIIYATVYVISTKNWLIDNQQNPVSNKVAILLRKIVKMVEFDLGQMIYDDFVKHAEKVYKRYLMPFSSLIFQVIFKQNPRIVRTTEQHEKLMPKLKFSHKWLEGKHKVNEPEEQSKDDREGD